MMKINKRRLFLVAVLTGIPFIVAFFMAHFTFASKKDYFQLLELIQAQNSETPLYVFNDFEEDFDEDYHKSNLDYFNEHPELVRRIKNSLAAEEFQWRLDSLKQRLLFVPEKREGYAALLEAYCRDVIEYILNKTDLSNPYDKIETLRHERPMISQGNVTAFLVNNLAKESLSTYTFSNHSNKTLMVELRGKVYLGEIGSYTTNIHLKDSGTFEFSKDNYTIWQTSAENPYAVLMVPVEETFHIVLREHTHRAIREQIELNSIKDIEDVTKIVKEWITVEEALAGALVHALLPNFFKEHAGSLPHAYLEKAMESKRDFEKYAYLEKGIQVVEHMGIQDAIKLYTEDPKKFKKLLVFGL